MNETLSPNSEQKLFDKLKRKRLVMVLSNLAGITHGYFDVQWKNGSIRCMNADKVGMARDILLDSLDDPSHTGTVRYIFGDSFSVELEYLTTK